MINTEILQDIYTDHDLCGVQKRELLKTIAMIKQGRLIEMPCAVGDTVQEIVLLPMFPEDGMRERYIIWEKKFRLEDIEDFGKTVFLTKEEAEAKLRDLLEIENVKIFKEKCKELKKL